MHGFWPLYKEIHTCKYPETTRHIGDLGGYHTLSHPRLFRLHGLCQPLLAMLVSKQTPVTRMSTLLAQTMRLVSLGHVHVHCAHTCTWTLLCIYIVHVDIVLIYMYINCQLFSAFFYHWPVSPLIAHIMHCVHIEWHKTELSKPKVSTFLTSQKQ